MTYRMAALGWLLVALAACGGASGSPQAEPTTAKTTPDPTDPPASPVMTEPPLEALELLWESAGDTTPTGPFPSTYSPAVDPLTGDIWVSLGSDDVIWIFGSDGAFKDSFGKSGDGPGEFEFTRPACRECPGAGALAFAPDGSLFVADVGNQRVQKFDPEHEFQAEWGSFGAGEGQFADATQIATNGREVYVSDDVRQDTQVFDMDGSFLRTFPASGWLAIGSAGNLLMSRLGEIATYDAQGQVGDATPIPDYAGGFHIGLAASDDGRLFFDYQNDATGEAIALGELDPSTGASRIWSTAGETLTIADDVLYEANYTGPGWPEAVLRAYRLPEP